MEALKSHRIDMKRLSSAIPLALVLLATAGLQAQTAHPHAGALAEFSLAVEELCASVSPAVVQIEVRTRTQVDSEDERHAGYFAKESASGSGVIVDPSGYIITNAHVAESRDISVSVADTSDPARKDAHKHYPATIVGMDKETDIALLKIEASNLPTLSFLDSDTLKQGQLVFALGSPLGLDNTLTVGYVSATSRRLNTEQLVTYIQTDAPINPGNSGGPLLDMNGRVAGINTMIYSQSGGSEGIGFAIPANIVRHAYEQLRKDGHIRRGTIGVVVQDIDLQMSQALGLNHHPGVILADVTPHGAAEAAGLEQGDIVLAVDGKPVTQTHQAQAVVLQHAVGDNVTLDIQRGGEKMQKTVAVIERPNSPVALADLVNGQANLVRELGILAMTLDEKVTPELPDTRRLYGVVVAAIPVEFAALNPGLKPGDIIYELNAKQIHSLGELREALSRLKPGDPVVLLAEHEGTLGYVSFAFE
jgi:serine protease Do